MLSGHLVKYIKTSHPSLSHFTRALSSGQKSSENPQKENQKRKFTILDPITNKSLPKISSYLQLIRFNKPAGIFPLLIPSLWAISLATPASCIPDLTIVSLFTVGAFLCRSAGCIINDIIDVDFDKHVERTALRPLASGNLSITQAVCTAGVLLSLAFCILVQFNILSIILGVSSLFFVVAYPFMKRFVNYPQAFLGLTFNWGCLLGTTAVRGTLDPSYCLPLYLTGFLWTLIYDTIYAHQDKEFDALIGLKSSALSLGYSTKSFSWACLSGMTMTLFLMGRMHDLAAVFYPVVGLATLMQSLMIWRVDLDDPATCWRFFSLQAVYGMLILMAILLGNYNKQIH